MIEFGTWNSHDRNGNGSHGNRLYLREECTNRKNLYRSCVGMPPVYFFLRVKTEKPEAEMAESVE